jgi:hypothetical protein
MRRRSSGEEWSWSKNDQRQEARGKRGKRQREKETGIE